MDEMGDLVLSIIIDKTLVQERKPKKKLALQMKSHKKFHIQTYCLLQWLVYCAQLMEKCSFHS